MQYLTAALYDCPFCSAVITKPSVPLKVPVIFFGVSPALISRVSVWMTGRPAHTARASAHSSQKGPARAHEEHRTCLLPPPPAEMASR